MLNNDTNAKSCSNHVDHHISTREQITLQDIMEGVVYSTLQFGLDGKFLVLDAFSFMVFIYDAMARWE